jgi:energy-coupling factor transporter ATP-binding protein EcfA2
MATGLGRFGMIDQMMAPSYQQQRRTQALPPASLVGYPRRPGSISQLGIRQAVLEDLGLKILYLSGPFSVLDFSSQMRVSPSVADELMRRLCAMQLCEVTGMHGDVPEIAITSQGRSRALELLSLSQYADATPVPIGSYVDWVLRQSVRNVEVHPSDVEKAFAHLVLDGRTLWQIGVAINSGGSIFLHGPTGVGKTTIAETLSRLVAADPVWVPYSVELNGQIISIHDPLVHRSVNDAPGFEEADPRWVLCHRPVVTVGGELTMDMLDLQFDPTTKFYNAPIQMKANNGVLIIDDFGRQRVRPEELLNRWIVPLDRRLDFLKLAGGKKLEIPLEILVVFATNMDPAKLVDAAFLRRIQTKIRIGSISDEQFCEIFRRVCKERGLEYDSSMLTDVVEVIRGKQHQALRPCYARDIVNQICWAARYERKEPIIEHASVMKAVENCFLSKS